MFGQCHARIVAGLNNQAFKQIGYGYLFADFDKHLGTLHAPGFLTDDDHFIQSNITIGYRFVHQVGRHQFGDTRRFHPIIRILFRQYPARIKIDQVVAGGIQCRRIGNGLGGPPQDCWHQQNQQAKQ